MERKVGFFKSIQFKLIIIYVLLILIAMQIMGVYFTRQLEDQLVENHFNMLDERADLLAYSLVEPLTAQWEDRAELTAEVN
ncbi:cell wall metabolism sensor histidine kinase WalK, partial [Halalkalibacterium halodurans]|nr:cell wall metabolism sensor histidine kinase WalK [Halalkalibacterium halodurans]